MTDRSPGLHMAVRTLIAALLISTWMCVGVTLAQAPPQSDSPHAQQQKLYRENASQYPLLKQTKIEQVLHCLVDDGQLTVEAVVEPDREFQQKRAELEGLSEPAIVLCFLVSQDLGQIEFDVNVDDYRDPAAIGHLSIQAKPSNNESGKLLKCLDIKKTWETPTGSRTVFFTQANESATLTVSNGASDLFGTAVSEKDFVTLRRNHHAETERWLRPILRELHQESAFAPDPQAACQVLSADWPIDDKLIPEITANLPALDDNDFRIRLRAATALQKLGRDGALVIQKMDRHHLSLEQNLRLDDVVAHFQPLPGSEARRLYSDPTFLLDCLYSDDAIARKLALKRLREITDKPIEFDVNAPEAARVNAVNALRETVLGTPKSESPEIRIKAQ